MVTIKDISQKIGISHATVSYVLNGREKEYHIRPEMAEKIRTTARELGYIPNAAARSMVKGKSRSIACIERSSTSRGEYSHRLLSGVLSIFNQEDYMVKIFRVSEEKGEDEKLFRQILSYQTAGALIVSIPTEESKSLLEKFHSLSIPCGILNNKNETSTGFGVYSDDTASQKEAVKYLASQGHRRIAYLEGNQNWHYNLLRRNGYQEGMKEFLPGEKERIFSISLETPFGGSQDLLKEILMDEPAKRPTAFLCDSDYHAMEVFRAAYSLNLRIPDDLSIVGFGGLTPAEYSPVPFATSRQKYEEMGALAARLLLDHLQKKTPIDGVNQVIENSFTPGPSAGPVPPQ